jgi:Dolichyl-phosphate-mannose-protein mannosyltransferase
MKAPPFLSVRFSPSTLAAAAVVIVCAAVWFVGLGERHLWSDEAFTWQVTQFDLPRLFSALADDVHPPGHFLLLKGWVYVFGDSEFALRSPSVLAAALMLVALALAVYEALRTSPERLALPPSRAALYAVLLAASSPFVFRFAREARMYALGGCLALFGSWTLLRALGAARGRLPWLALYSLLRLAALYTHNWLWFTLVGDLVACTTAGVLLAHRDTARAWAYWQVVGAGVLSGLLYLPWLPSLLRQWAHVRQEYWTRDYDWCSVLNSPVRVAWMATTSSSLLLAGLVIAIFLLLALAALRHRSFAPAYLLLMALFPALVAYLLGRGTGRGLFDDRFLFFSYPYGLAAVAAALAGIRNLPVRRLLAGTAVASLLSALLFFLLSPAPPQPGGIRDLAARLRSDRSDGERVVVSTKFGFYPAKYYLRGTTSPCLLGTKQFGWDGLAAIDTAEVVPPEELSGPRVGWLIELQAWTKLAPEKPPGMTLERVERFPELFPMSGNGGFEVSAWQLYRVAPAGPESSLSPGEQ